MAKLHKKRGTSHRSKSKNPKVKKGYETELEAARHLESRGWTVRMGTGIGPDLFISKGRFEFTVEVKPTTAQNGCYWIGKVKPKRKNDDFIAFVFPNKKVYLTRMSSHLEKCSSAGYRTITKLVKEFGLP